MCGEDGETGIQICLSARLSSIVIIPRDMTVCGKKTGRNRLKIVDYKTHDPPSIIDNK